MPEHNGRELFVGLSADEKAISVLEHLSVDEEITVYELADRSGLTINQVHTGMREARNCVVTNRRGPDSTYKLAQDAHEVREYAVRRMRHWQSQITVIHKEMMLTRKLMLPGARAAKVEKAADVIALLLHILELDEMADREQDKRERQLAAREAKLDKRSRGRARAKVPA
jgi:hypothetical protein